MLRPNHAQEHAVSFLHSYLDRVRTNLSVVDHTLARYGHLSLLDYLKNFEASVKPPFQERGPLLCLVHDYVSPLLGEAAAKGTADDLAAYPLVLTTSHHGVDFYAQTLQSRLILALRNTSGLSLAGTVPVFACGNIPLNNLTFPRGMLLYRLAAGDFEAAPRRLPLFPDRLKRTMVSVAPVWQRVMIHQARAQLDKMIRQGTAVAEIALAARTLLDEDYRAAALQSLSDYSQQAVVVNQHIWKRLFARGFDPPTLVYLELEKIASALLGLDRPIRSALPGESCLTGCCGNRCWPHWMGSGDAGTGSCSAKDPAPLLGRAWAQGAACPAGPFSSGERTLVDGAFPLP